MPSWSTGPDTPEDIAAERAWCEATKDLTRDEILAECRRVRADLARGRTDWFKPEDEPLVPRPERETR